MKKKYDYFRKGLLLIVSLCMANLLMAQDPLNIHGTITGTGNEPVPAVITIKGSARSVNTDDKGTFTLANVPSNAVLIISGSGIVTLEVPVNGRTDIGNIKISPRITTIGTVTVEANTGYQSLKPNETNGSVVVLDKRAINQQAGSNILARLDGNTSGLLVNVGKSTSSSSQNKTNISIRGVSTINGPLDPLIVLNGFIYEGNIANINPNDVENITVLKDAAAASVWGARAGNGVIVITTRKSNFNQRMTVNASAGAIISAKPNLSGLPIMSSADYIDFEQMIFNDNYFDYIINDFPYYALTPAVDIFSKRRRGLISAADSATAIDQLKAVDTRDQYRKYVYQQAVTSQYNVGVQGGNSSNAYNFSFGYEKINTELRAENNKVNIRFDNSFRAGKNLRLDVSTYYTNSRNLSGTTGYGADRVADRNVPYFSIAAQDGSALPVATVYNPDYTDTAGAGKLLDWKYYPLTDYLHDRTKTNLQELYATLGLNYAIGKYFNVDLKYQYQNQQSTAENVADIESYFARDLINSYSQVNYANGLVTYIVPKGGIRTLDNSVVNSQTLRGQLNFKRTWGRHQLVAIAGAEQREAKARRNGYTVYGYNADPLTMVALDAVHDYPLLPTGDVSNPVAGPSSSSTTFRFISLYSNAAYTYKERYSFSASGRRDGSNIFGANTNDRWKPLWSVGGGWKISGENFYHSRLVEYLRVKATYGHSGNVDLTKTALPVASASTNDPITGLPRLAISRLNNPDLRWEQSRQLDIGLEFATKNNRISGSFDVYRKNGYDLYGESAIDYTAAGGFATVVKNVAATKGKGIDLVLNSININRAVRWNTTLLFSYNKVITSAYFDAAANDPMKQLGGGTNILPFVGKDLYGIVAYRWGGLDNMGNPQGYLNGQLSTNYLAIRQQTGGLDDGHLVYMGSGTPKYFGAIANTVSWRQFSLTVNMVYKLGYFFRKTSIVYNTFRDIGAGNKEFADRWQQPGDELRTNVPSFIYPIDDQRDGFYNNSSINVLKGAHIRLQYINLSYLTGLKFGNNPNSKNIELYANASNLGIIWRANNRHLDPDYPGGLAPSTTMAFGIRCNF